jgi:hypothetical protein
MAKMAIMAAASSESKYGGNNEIMAKSQRRK